MNDERHAGRELSDAAQRQAALRALASHTTTSAPSDAESAHTCATPASSPLPSRLATPRGGVGRRIVSTLTVLAVVAVIGVVVANIIGGMRPAAPAAKSALRLNPIGDGLSCATQVAWSPDGKEIAALGDTVNCDGSASESQTGTVLIYNAQSGKVVERLQPDNLIFKAPVVSNAIAAVEGATSSSLTLNYGTFTWAPNGQALLMPFDIDIAPPEGQSGASRQMPGLLRLETAQPSKATAWLANVTYIQSGEVERWDVSIGKLALVPAPPAATRYRWNSDGTLSPAGSATNQPVGTPDGGQTFTIWQAGYLQFALYQNGQTAQPAYDAQDILWGAIVAPVSPDSRYLYTYFPAFGSLAPPSTHHALPHEATVEPHDKALLTLAQQMAQTPNPQRNGQTLIAWRPDGHLMAAVTQNAAAPVSASAFAVSLYDTTTGKLVKRLTPDFTGLRTGAAGIEALAWSPDGQRLLLMDNVYGAITVWGPGALPA